MFSPCVFVTCQNLQFWQVCSFNGFYLPKLHFGKYVDRFICLYVCLFVCDVVPPYLKNKSSDHHQTWSTYGTWTCEETYCFWCWCITDDVIRSKNRSNFEIVISQAVFKLQHRNKNWNAALIMGHYSVMVNFRCHFRLNTKFWHQNGSHFENAKILHAASIWYQIWKDRPKLCKKKYFSWWWRHPWRHRLTSKSPLYVHI